MEDYHRREKEKQEKVRARGRVEFSPKRSNKSKGTTSSSASATSSSRFSSASSTSHLPLSVPTSAQPTPPSLERTTRNDAYKGPPVGSEAYKKLKTLMLPPVNSRLGRKPNIPIKSRLGQKPAHDRLTPQVTPQVTHTQQGLPPTTSSPAPSPTPSTSAPDWTGTPASPGKTNRKSVKRTPRPNQRFRRSKSNSTTVVSGSSTMSNFSTKGYNITFKFNAKNAYDVLTNPDHIRPIYDPSFPHRLTTKTKPQTTWTSQFSRIQS